MCEDCLEPGCNCDKCYIYRHNQACPVCGHTVLLDCCQGFITHKYDIDYKIMKK